MKLISYLVTSVLIFTLTGGCKTPVAATERPAETTRTIATLSEQKICADQAQKSFENWADTRKTTYTNHYDPTVGVCYIEVTTRDNLGQGLGYYLTVSDAFEGRIYGQYTEYSGPGWSKIGKCEVTPRDRPQIECHTSKEFDNLVLRYFGTTAD